MPTDNLFQLTLSNPTVSVVGDEVYLCGAGGDFRVGKSTGAGVELLSIRQPYDVKGRERQVVETVARRLPLTQKFVDATWRNVSQASRFSAVDAFQKNLRKPAPKHYFRQH